MRTQLVFGIIGVLVAANATASVIPPELITVTGDYCTTCPFPAGPERTIDRDLDTQWHGVNDIPLGAVNILAYHFKATTSLQAVGLWFINPLDVWTAGELDVQWSSDTTDGFDGTWTTLASLPGDTPNYPKPIIIPFASVDTEWARLRMEYQGRGASGVSPAFGLNEILFIPEPSMLFVLGWGLVHIVGYRRKRQS